MSTTVQLKTKFAGLNFKNPLVMASGPLGASLASMERGIEADAAAVTLKSAFVEPTSLALMQPRPRHRFLQDFGLPRVMTFCGGMGLTVEEEVELISQIRPMAKEHGCFIIGNLSVLETDLQKLPEFAQAVRRIAEAGADSIEIVCACPCARLSPAEDLKSDQKLLTTLLRRAKKETDVPIIAKLPYEYHAYFMGMLQALKDMGQTLLHIYTRYRGTVIDIEKMEPLLPGPVAQYYGPIRRPATNLAVALAKAFDHDFEIMSSGGVFSANDCIERMLCGASLVALHTAIQYRGQRLFTNLRDGISDFLNRKQCGASDIVGRVVPQVAATEAFERYKKSLDAPKSTLTLEVDLEKCTGCGLCTNCVYGAWVMKDGIPVLDLELCERCGVCDSLCPVGAIVMRKV